ncbi:MAG: hypothetical protein LC130_08570 [Bryobacterales bacterium]|nr:hypothetical protein [Bryobacterales bacterium]
MEIPPRTAHLVNPLTSIATTQSAGNPFLLGGRSSASSVGGSGAGFDESIALSQLLNSKSAVSIAVDLIVFDTGKIIGPDEGNTLTYLRGWVTAEREIASLLHTALNSGTTSQLIIEQLRQLLAQFDKDTIRGAYDQLARLTQIRHFLRLAASSADTLVLRNEIGRILSKPITTFHR